MNSKLVMNLHEQGLTNIEIAKTLKISGTSVWRWLTKLNLKPNHKLNSKKFLNKTFNNLTILSYLNFNDKYGRPMTECLCSCGQIIEVSLYNLKYDTVKRCIDCKRVLHSLKLEPGVAGMKRLYGRYKVSAKTRDLVFNITLDDFKKLTSSNCYYCDEIPLMKSFTSSSIKRRKATDRGSYKYNGLDRINNKVGYIKNNLVSCCKNCNYAKRDLSQLDFLNWIIKVYQNQSKKDNK